MVAVKGFFDGKQVFVRQQIPVQEQCEVIITFLNADAAESARGEAEAEEVADIERRQEGLKQMMKYTGTLRADFDYKKELAEYRDERYDATH
ncbi:MAG: hypothetical protein Ta2G_21300 [Termitinemataceae bacterium]|nr:MAG: hypothetical protein Ta2G_21300 [Termitinemataceae bacterium]